MGCCDQPELGLPKGCKVFGEAASSLKVKKWLESYFLDQNSFSFLLVLAGSCTAEVEGISAAGATSLSRRYTAVADAELLLLGPKSPRQWPLPPLSAGISPALISYVATRFIGLTPNVLAVGLPQPPSFPHLRIELPSLGPASCLSTGKAMDFGRVQALWEKGFSMGLRLREPILIAECVPGGTTTAQAVLTGLGLLVDDLISGSALNPPRALKRELVEKGLKASGLGLNAMPKKLLAAVGDPFQAFAVGLLIGARKAGQQVLLGGGSQMLAILALALKAVQPSMRASLADGVVLGTTAWLAEESVDPLSKQNSLACLMDRIEQHFDVELIGLATGLRFYSSKQKVLRDYEKGYIKEGVGAGALSLLSQIKGVSLKAFVEACDEAVAELHLGAGFE